MDILSGKVGQRRNMDRQGCRDVWQLGLTGNQALAVDKQFEFSHTVDFIPNLNWWDGR